MTQKFLREDKGTTAIEYGLIGAAVVTAVVIGLPLLGVTVRGFFQNVAHAFTM